MVWDVRRDEVELGDGQTVTREVIDHTGAVGVVALDDAATGCCCSGSTGTRCGPTSGSCRPGCSTSRARTRCSRRSASSPRRPTCTADEWHVLVDFYNSPGGSTEAFRCYLARGLHEVPHGDRHEREHEERGMVPRLGPARRGP